MQSNGGHMIRLNKGRVSKESPPYNELYMNHQEFFEKLFEPRKTVAKEFTYVPIEAENELKAFIGSKQNSFCVLYGPMGIGKTTLIDHIKRHFNQVNGFYVFKYDLNRHVSSLNLGEDFFSLPEEQQIERCNHLATDFIHKNLLGDIVSLIGSESLQVTFYDFIKKNNPSFLMPDGIYAKSKREKLTLLKEFSRDHILPYTYVALKYMSEIKKIKHFTIIIDNCDLKHHLLISSFVDILCHAIKCIGSHEYVDSISCVLTCRNYTKNKLYKGRDANALGAHGDRYIQIHKPCTISDLIDYRFKEMPSSLSDISFKTTSSSGMNWNIDKRNNFLQRLSTVLKNEKLENLLVDLCNYDMSLALECMHKIIRNKDFFDPNKLLPGMFSEVEVHKTPVLTMGSFLNCLAYGNSVKEKGTFYPSEDTVIVNLFEWDGKNENTFMGFIRIILLLLNEKCIPETDGPGMPFRQIDHILHNILSIDSATTTTLLHRMFDLGLIFAHSNTCPTKTNGNDSYILTQRAITLFDLLSSGSQLLEFYSDDTYFSEKEAGSKLALRMLPFKERPFRLLRFVRFIADMENKQLQKLVDNKSSYKLYSRRFSSTIISRKCLENINASMDTYYKPRAEGLSLSEINLLLAEIQDKIEIMTTLQ